MARPKTPKKLYSLNDIARELGVGLATPATWWKRRTQRLPVPDYIMGTEGRPLWTEENFKEIISLNREYADTLKRVDGPTQTMAV